MIAKTTINYYGDKFKSFFARVVNVNDPLQLGRVQIRAIGIHSESEEDIPTVDLPWAMCIIPTTEGGVSGIGLSTGIKPFSLVYGYFADGDNAQEPMVLGSIPNYQRDPLMRELQDKDNPDDFRISPVAKPDNPDDLLYGSTNLEKAWNWFKGDRGGQYSNIITAGILGNLWVESAGDRTGDLNPAQEQDDGGPGFGLAQWERWGKYNDRYLELVQRLAGLPLTSMTAQLKHITHELNSYSYLGKAELLQSTTVEEASDIFMIKYERPEKYTIPLAKPVSLGGTRPSSYDYIPDIYPSTKKRRKAARDILNNLTT
jgi:hypothetical protein